MPRGGARAVSGPAPDPNALRRDRKEDKAGWINLPATFDGDVPEWPLAPMADDADSFRATRELELWQQLWAMPQAAMWGNCVNLVAMYARIRAEAELTLDSKMLSESRMRENMLGISPDGMLRLRWRIQDQAVTDPEPETTASGTKRRKAGASMRDRFKVLDGGGQ